MRPIPVGASAAMLSLSSLLLWFHHGQPSALLAGILRGPKYWSPRPRTGEPALSPHHDAPDPILAESRPVLHRSSGAASDLNRARSLGLVRVKMLPFDNKSELQVVINMPDGTPLEQTARVAQALGEELARQPDVLNYQVYAGTSGPYNFNGLVRHYYMRRQPNQADIQVNLLPAKQRSEQSHVIAKRLRPLLDSIGAAYGARIQVSEVPPGPPVCKLWWRRSTVPTWLVKPRSLSRSSRSSNRLRALSMLTGTSRTPSQD